MAALAGYRLRNGSPGIDAGLAIAENGGIDILKTAIDSADVDVGAVESSMTKMRIETD